MILGRTSIIKHQINLVDDRPFKSAPYRVPPSLRTEMETQIQNMLEHGIIEASLSPWSSPVVLVLKKDKTFRFCIDFRRLNKLTIRDSFPLPRVDDTLDALSGAKYFTKLDLSSAYLQVELDEAAKEKTAFVTLTGLYQYKVLPYGLTNAPGTFQRLMNHVLHGLNWVKCLVYLDDIVVFSSEFETHIKDLESVFKRLQSASLKLQPSKCVFATNEMIYLGYLVSNKGLLPDPSKIKAIKSINYLQSPTDIRSFMGIISYYRRFIPKLSQLAYPLYELTRDNIEFKWTDECQMSFGSTQAVAHLRTHSSVTRFLKTVYCTM